MRPSELKTLTSREFFDLEQSLWRFVRNCFSFYQDEYDDRELEPLILENYKVYYHEGNETIIIIKNKKEFYWSQFSTNEQEDILIEFKNYNDDDDE